MRIRLISNDMRVVEVGGEVVVTEKQWVHVRTKARK
jgi:hypothetical protein